MSKVTRRLWVIHKWYKLICKKVDFTWSNSSMFEMLYAFQNVTSIVSFLYLLSSARRSPRYEIRKWRPNTEELSTSNRKGNGLLDRLAKSSAASSGAISLPISTMLHVLPFIWRNPFDFDTQKRALPILKVSLNND